MMTRVHRSARRFLAPLVLVLACGDDAPPGSSGSGDGSSGAPGSSSGDIGATSLATASGSDEGTSTSGSSTGTLDGTSTGGEALPCDVCAETDVCVIDFSEKVCGSCDDPDVLPYQVECVPEIPAACDDALTHTRACALALCGTPHAYTDGCCSVPGDFTCGVTMQPQACDYWNADQLCDPTGEKCVPARDEQLQPLPYTECTPLEGEPVASGASCYVDFQGDPCEPTTWCDEVDPATMTGTCRSLCVGDEAMPSCADPSEICVLFSEGQPQFGGVCRPA